MRTNLRRTFIIALGIGLAACGGDGVAGEPILGGDVAGAYEGSGFTPVHGIAAVTEEGIFTIVLGTGNVVCGSEDASSPLAGYNAAIAVPTFAVGTYTNVYVSMSKTAGGFEASGGNDGLLTITAVTDDSISGEIQHARTSPNNEMYMLTGTFEVVRCAD
jgi:hypothetical protein